MHVLTFNPLLSFPRIVVTARPSGQQGLGCHVLLHLPPQDYPWKAEPASSYPEANMPGAFHLGHPLRALMEDRHLLGLFHREAMKHCHGEPDRGLSLHVFKCNHPRPACRFLFQDIFIYTKGRVRKGERERVTLHCLTAQMGCSGQGWATLKVLGVLCCLPGA